MKEAHEIFDGPSKIFKNVSWLINICLNYFMAPAKTLRPQRPPTPPPPHPPPPTYLMYGPLKNAN